MPLTELLVAVYVVCMMLRYTKQPATRGAALHFFGRFCGYVKTTGHPWGGRLNFDLCINTTQTVIKDIVPVIAKLF